MPGTPATPTQKAGHLRSLTATIYPASSRAGRLTYGLFLILTSAIGLLAAFTLTVEKVRLLIHPDTKASCDFSLLVQCGKNLSSWQGSVFGFPNPLIGLIGWALILTTGFAVLAGARLARWYWIGANVGAAGAMTFVVWLIHERIFDLGTLCPWCMVTWSVVIPLFIGSTLWNLKHGVYAVGPKVRAAATELLGWTPVIALVAYFTVAVIAQLRLDVLAHL